MFSKLNDLMAMVRVRLQFSQVNLSFEDCQEDLKFCYDILTRVSRSFSFVIIRLSEELRNAICIFYLVLRGLDTVEDDMDIPVEDKLRDLPVFHQHLDEHEWCLYGVGKSNERPLLEQFYRVSREYQKLKPEYRAVISDICYKMAIGMCHFLQTQVETTADYDLYCHYVAGLVGHGLTRLFAKSGLEDQHLADNLDAANNMGLFLQKTNIIRDYFEDIVEVPPRLFWPKDIWGHFGKVIFDFKKPENKTAALQCLNALVADALRHIPDCINYLSTLKEPSIFSFCAIPQIMAIATLTEVYNNINVFFVKVKISKGSACRSILNSKNLDSTLSEFASYMDVLYNKLNEEDPSYDLIVQRLTNGYRVIEEHQDEKKLQSVTRFVLKKFSALGGEYLVGMIDSISGYMWNDSSDRIKVVQ